MAGMSRNNSTNAFQGFSVSQAFIGAPLHWLPAMGTAELDELVHAFLPGPSSIQDKRAHISMDFFEYARQTGETFKFYAVPSASFAAALTNSPATSSSIGYNSSFNVSPIISDLSPWTQSPASFSAPSVTSEKERTKSQSSASKKSTASSSRQAIDFTNHPGMRIMTKDGRDVTNSASRGSKSKEQRDHAHLMRIIKACPDCKRKKIRCDPSHKKKSSSQAASASLPSQHKPGRKEKKSRSPPTPAPPPLETDLAATSSSFDLTAIPDLADFGADQVDMRWDDFIQFDHEPLDTVARYNDFSISQELDFFSIPQDYDFNSAPQSNFTPSLGTGSSSASPSQAFTPFTPPQSVPVLSGDSSAAVTHQLPANEPLLPYLNPGEPHGTNYVDFNLYSPTSDFSDEEPRPVRALPPQSLQSWESHQQAVNTVTSHEVLAQQMLIRTAPIEHTGGLARGGLFGLPLSTSEERQPSELSEDNMPDGRMDARQTGVDLRSTSPVRPSGSNILRVRTSNGSRSPLVTINSRGELFQTRTAGPHSLARDRSGLENAQGVQGLSAPATYTLPETISSQLKDPHYSIRGSSTSVVDRVVTAQVSLHEPNEVLQAPVENRTAAYRVGPTVHSPAVLSQTACAPFGARLTGLDSDGRASPSLRRHVVTGTAPSNQYVRGPKEPAPRVIDLAAIEEVPEVAMLLVGAIGLVLFLLVSTGGLQQGACKLAQQMPTLLSLAGIRSLPLGSIARGTGKKSAFLEGNLRRMRLGMSPGEPQEPISSNFLVDTCDVEPRHRSLLNAARENWSRLGGFVRAGPIRVM